MKFCTDSYDNFYFTVNFSSFKMLFRARKHNWTGVKKASEVGSAYLLERDHLQFVMTHFKGISYTQHTAVRFWCFKVF